MFIGKDKIGEIHTFHIHPLTIIPDRYHGKYSGGEFTVWNLYHENIPTDISGSDTEACEFWNNDINAEDRKLCGVGNTIQAAINDLYYKLDDPMLKITYGDLPKWISYNAAKRLIDEGITPTDDITIAMLEEAIYEYDDKRKEYLNED